MRTIDRPRLLWALTSTAQLCIIAGFPGSGRTRFLDQLGAAKQRAGATLVRVQCEQQVMDPGVLLRLVSSAIHRTLSSGNGTPPADSAGLSELITAHRSPVFLALDDLEVSDAGAALLVELVERTPELDVALVSIRLGHLMRALAPTTIDWQCVLPQDLEFTKDEVLTLVVDTECAPPFEGTLESLAALITRETGGHPEAISRGLGHYSAELGEAALTDLFSRSTRASIASGAARCESSPQLMRQLIVLSLVRHLPFNQLSPTGDARLISDRFSFDKIGAVWGGWQVSDEGVRSFSWRPGIPELLHAVRNRFYSDQELFDVGIAAAHDLQELNNYPVAFEYLLAVGALDRAEFLAYHQHQWILDTAFVKDLSTALLKLDLGTLREHPTLLILHSLARFHTFGLSQRTEAYLRSCIAKLNDTSGGYDLPRRILTLSTAAHLLMIVSDRPAAMAIVVRAATLVQTLPVPADDDHSEQAEAITAACTLLARTAFQLSEYEIAFALWNATLDFSWTNNSVAVEEARAGLRAIVILLADPSQLPGGSYPPEAASTGGTAAVLGLLGTVWHALDDNAPLQAVDASSRAVALVPTLTLWPMVATVHALSLAMNDTPGALDWYVSQVTVPSSTETEHGVRNSTLEVLAHTLLTLSSGCAIPALPKNFDSDSADGFALLNFAVLALANGDPTRALQATSEVVAADSSIPRIQVALAILRAAAFARNGNSQPVIDAISKTLGYLSARKDAGALAFALISLSDRDSILAVLDEAGQNALATRFRTYCAFATLIPNESEIITLTTRERQILLEVARGRSNPEIAIKLRISPNTVKFHLKGLSRKLGASNRNDVIERATVAKLLG